MSCKRCATDEEMDSTSPTAFLDGLRERFVSIFQPSRLYALQIPYSKQVNLKDVCTGVMGDSAESGYKDGTESMRLSRLRFHVTQ